MILAVAVVAVLAYWAENRESAAALEDFAQQQPTLARSLAVDIKTRLDYARRDALIAAEAQAEGRPIPRRIAEQYLALRVRGAGEPTLTVPRKPDALLCTTPAPDGRRVDLAISLSTLLTAVGSVEQPNGLILMLLPPGSREFHATDGRVLGAEPLFRALELGQVSLRLAPLEAARLGLPRLTALAGLAAVDAGALGRWGIAAVASAERERDREQRARRRLLLSIILAGGLVLAFGGVSLHTQRKELALQHQLAIAGLVQERDERLERASKAATMGTLAMGIAHEVSTPLGVITGRAEQLLPRLGDDERGTRNVRAILEQADQISQVIRAFLGLVRGDRPPAQQIEPAAVVRGATGLVEHRLAKAGVSLMVDAPDELPPLHGDPHLLQHALVNLLLNACEACGRGGRVEIHVRDTGSSIRFVVEDDGQGISPGDAERATEPFFTTKRQGTGLGLAIANEIVKSHGGTLLIAPRATGGGTSASIDLPLAGRASHEAA